MSCCGKIEAVESTAEPADGHSADPLEQKLRHASVNLENGILQTEFCVPDMHCAGCIAKIERNLGALPGVERVRANLSLKRVSIIWNVNLGSAKKLAEALERLGFEYSLFDQDIEVDSSENRQGRELLTSLAVAGFAAANIMLLSVSVWSGADLDTTKLFHLISGVIAIPAVFIAGKPFFRSALKSLRGGTLNMDVPISLAVLLALGMSVYESLTGGAEAYFDAAVTLLFFLLIGRYLDFQMRQRARAAAAQLASIVSRGATVVFEDGRTGYVPLSDISEGMILQILPGERFPVDCRIARGETQLDRSLVTGESIPVSAIAGDRIEAGVLNVSTPIRAEALGGAKVSFLAEMQRMMEQAENGRSRYVRIADRMARIYAPAVHLLALLAFLGWMIVSAGDLHLSIYIAISVLIVTCPCALGLAVPVAHVIGANRLLKSGILMRDGSALERMAQIDTVVFDKTGTLTRGEPSSALDYELEGPDAGIIKSPAGVSSHPLATGTTKLLKDVAGAELDEVEEIPGFGVEGKFQGNRVRFGKPSWVAELSGQSAMPGTEMCVAFATEGMPLVLLAFQDKIRKDAKQTCTRIQQAGLEAKILSGDRKPIVSEIAGQVGIDCWLHDHTPAQKVDYLEKLRNEGRHVLMVGDGLNDAPALASGYVSMAPASACDAGRYAADFIFTRQELSAVLETWLTARDTAKIVRQNFAIAIVYNCIAVPLAMAGYVTPLIAAIAMSASSILVVANSMRIHRFDPTATGSKSADITIESKRFVEGAA